MLVLTLSLARCSSWCLRPQMPVIMAGLDHRTSVEVHRCSLGQGFSPGPLLCYVCLGPDSVLHSLAFPQLQFITVVDDAFALCSLSLSAGPCCQASCTAWTIPGSTVLGQVVLSLSLCNARYRFCPGSAQRCPWRHHRCSFWTRSFSLRQMPWSTQCAVAGYLQGHQLSYCGAEAVPRCPGEVPQLPFSMAVVSPVCAGATGCSLPVVIPQVRLLDKFVKPVWWRLQEQFLD